MSTNASPSAGGSSEGVSPISATPNRRTAGAKTDVAWNHGVAVGGNSKKIKCKYCGKEVSGGVYRLKHHLAGTHSDVGACIAVPDDVRKQMWNVVASLQEKLNKRAEVKEFEDDVAVPDAAAAGKKIATVEPASLFKRKVMTTIDSIFKMSVREDACMDIASFFYNNALSFNVAKSEEFLKMCGSIAKHGLGFKPPSYHEIRVTYLNKKVAETNIILEEHRAYWMKIGCTIMTDGWTDRRRRTILNFLVNSPKGTVFLKSIDATDVTKTADRVFKMMDEIVDEIGEENVVQIVTDNAANYKTAGALLMEKRKSLYWTPCAAHCIDLMLEDFEKGIPLHRDTIAIAKKITTYIYSRTGLMSLLHHFTKGGDLIRPAATRFATSYLTLGCLNDNKGALIRMFTSEQWKFSVFPKSMDGMFVEKQITDKVFWKNILNCLRGAFPLVRVLRLVDSDEKPAMGFIYEEMDRAKEKIESAFNGVQRSYGPLWEIIDRRWDKQLHRPLHAAGYYLNPMMHYAPNFKADYEVKKGMYECLERMVAGLDERSKIDSQLEEFKRKSGMFGGELATRALKTKTPSQWWESYGDGYPELQKFAIRILSLTCSSSGCERNWSAFEWTRYAMAKALNVTQTSHSYGDLMILTRASELKVNCSIDPVEMASAEIASNITTSEAMALLDQFFSMNPDSNGRVRILDFLIGYGLGLTPLSEKVFFYLDVEKKGSITFRQFLYGLANIRKQPSFSIACESAFDKCSGSSRTHHVSLDQIGDIIHASEPSMSDETLHYLFHLFDVDGDQRISKDDFMTCLRKKPLLIAFFGAYLESIQ